MLMLPTKTASGLQPKGQVPHSVTLFVNWPKDNLAVCDHKKLRVWFYLFVCLVFLLKRGNTKLASCELQLLRCFFILSQKGNCETTAPKAGWRWGLLDPGDGQRSGNGREQWVHQSLTAGWFTTRSACWNPGVTKRLCFPRGKWLKAGPGSVRKHPGNRGSVIYW